MRVSIDGAIGLDMGVFIPVIEARGWDLPLCLDLLNVIENERFKRDDD